mmetsp:Transcript_45391/g.144717  ORF Transcript_45391/g.144717 Transcript_45391/m.144717 type:complete len:213 (+) Transcript_45391:1608-2246(+)
MQTRSRSGGRGTWATPWCASSSPCRSTRSWRAATSSCSACRRRSAWPWRTTTGGASRSRTARSRPRPGPRRTPRPGARAPRPTQGPSPSAVQTSWSSQATRTSTLSWSSPTPVPSWARSSRAPVGESSRRPTRSPSWPCATPWARTAPTSAAGCTPATPCWSSRRPATRASAWRPRVTSWRSRAWGTARSLSPSSRTTCRWCSSPRASSSWP